MQSLTMTKTIQDGPNLAHSFRFVKASNIQANKRPGGRGKHQNQFLRQDTSEWWVLVFFFFFCYTFNWFRKFRNESCILSNVGWLLTKNILTASTICLAGLEFKHSTIRSDGLVGQPRWAPMAADLAGTFSVIAHGHMAVPLCENALWNNPARITATRQWSVFKIKTERF